MFEDRLTSPAVCAGQGISFLKAFTQDSEKESQIQVVEEAINKEYPWAYFNGASRGNPPGCGGGGVIHLTYLF
jgi:hypothetical protein